MAEDIAAPIADLIHVSSILGAFGYVFSRNYTHAVEFKNSAGESLYLKTTKKLSIVLDPRTIRDGMSLGGRKGYASWNSNFGKFPKAPRNGASPEKHGIAFDIAAPDEATLVLRDLETL
jgi:hypothetical protein